MLETILKVYPLQKYQLINKFALVENSSQTRGSFSLEPSLNEGYKAKNLALQPMLEYYSADFYELSDLGKSNYKDGVKQSLLPPIREKIYFKDSILRFKSYDYTSQIPKGGTGHFLFDDCGYHFYGEMKNGKITKVDGLFQKGNNLSLYSEGMSNLHAKYHFEKLLESANNGTLKLQNLTKCYIKKILTSLPK